MKRDSTAIFYVLLAAITIGFAFQNHAEIENQRSACVRNSGMRQVVFNNTTNAVEENANRPEIRDVFEHNLKLLTDAEFVNAETGEVNCTAAFPAPFPFSIWED